MRLALYVVLALALVGAVVLGAANARARRDGVHCGCPASKNACTTPCSSCCAPGPCFGDPTVAHARRP